MRTRRGVNFALSDEPHDFVLRVGADLFVERDTPLVEALRGFELELTRLDGQKPLIKTSPGETVKSIATTLDPMAESSEATEWVTF